MKRTGRTARRVPRAAARTAALLGMLAATGLAAGAASASGSQPTATRAAAVSLSYLCRFPSGPQPVTVGVTATLPTVAETAKPIQPTGVTVTLALPRAAAVTLARLQSATVSAATRLTVSASEGSATTSVVWPGTTKRPVPRPAHGGLTVAIAGAVPPVTASSPGQVALTAAGLSVTFTAGTPAVPAPGPATSPMPSAGRPVLPASGPATPGAGGPAPAPAPGSTAQRPLQVGCVLGPGQQAALGAVLVVGKARRAAVRHAAVTTGKCPKLPPGGLKFNPRFPLPKVIKAPGTQVISFPDQGCAFTAGYADARKLKGAVSLSPTLTNVEQTVREVVNFKPSVNYADLDNIAELDFHGKHEFPPTTATFLTFGFVPTTATVALIEHGTINIYAIGPAISGICKPNKFTDCISRATVNSRLSVHIIPGSVTVNGVPLDVGPNCGTPAFDAIVLGTSATKPTYSLQFGGPLIGEVNIPKFHHCGVTENLDPIFDAAISGPQNFNLLTQGALCSVSNAFGCEPNTGRPFPVKPLRKVSG